MDIRLHSCPCPYIVTVYYGWLQWCSLWHTCLFILQCILCKDIISPLSTQIQDPGLLLYSLCNTRAMLFKAQIFLNIITHQVVVFMRLCVYEGGLFSITSQHRSLPQEGLVTSAIQGATRLTLPSSPSNARTTSDGNTAQRSVLRIMYLLALHSYIQYLRTYVSTFICS